MIKNIRYYIVCIFLACACTQVDDAKEEISIIPLPQNASINKGYIKVNHGFKVVSEQPSLLKLQELLNTFSSSIHNDKSTLVKVSLDDTLGEEAYKIDVAKNEIIIQGGSYRALVYGSNTLLQLSKSENRIPLGTIEDGPSYPYRGVMIDLSRSWHDVETLKQVISLASWYKLNYVQLHLTDDALFTFQSKLKKQVF